eukprot:COSAG01_NODE_579_length_15238_cov_10.570183_6_plen_98_part_00
MACAKLHSQLMLFARVPDYASCSSRGNRAKGRCLAAQGMMADAKAAFELAAHIPVKGGLYLYEVLALRDLKVLVLDKDGRGVYIHYYLVGAAVSCCA